MVPETALAANQNFEFSAEQISCIDELQPAMNEIVYGYVYDNLGDQAQLHALGLDIKGDGHQLIVELNFLYLGFSTTGLSRPRTARDVAHARKRVQRRRPRVLGIYFLAEDPKTPVKSVSRRPAGADRGARAILEPRASSHEQCIVVTSPVPRRFRPSPNHSFVSLAR